MGVVSGGGLLWPRHRIVWCHLIHKEDVCIVLGLYHLPGQPSGQISLKLSVSVDLDSTNIYMGLKKKQSRKW